MLSRDHAATAIVPPGDSPDNILLAQQEGDRLMDLDSCAYIIVQAARAKAGRQRAS
jgi:hypothetical protein